MSPETIEIRFARFQRTGDPEELGAVFDEVAPKLLLVAGHLAPEPHDAEDLVQSTFVEVLRARAAWSRERPLFPWMCGVLGNVAKRHRRRVARDLDRPPELRDPVEDPAALAASKDDYDRLVAAIDALEPIYRQALTLRLLRGMSHAEIAHVLGESPETIRTRVHRGLQRVRGAVPASLAVAMLAAAGGRGLAAVRAEVLSVAATLAPPAAVAGASVWTVKTLLGIQIMRSALVVVAVLMLFVAAFVALRSNAPSAGPGGATAGTSSPLLAGPVPSSPTPLDGGVARVEVNLPPPARDLGAVEEAPEVDEWRLWGRVRAPDGSALVGVQVRVALTELRAVFSESAWTDEEGRYELSLQPLREMDATERVVCSLEVFAVADGFLPRQQNVAPLPADSGVAWDVALDLMLETGRAVVGRVVDRAGGAIGGAQVTLIRRPAPPAVDDPNADGTIGAGTVEDLGFELALADGSFSIPLHSLDGALELRARDDVAGSATHAFVARPDEMVVDVGEVVVEPAHAVSGWMRLRDGSPLANHPVWVEDENTLAERAAPPTGGMRRGPTRRVVYTDAEGWFSTSSLSTPARFLEVMGARIDPQRFAVEPSPSAYVVDGCLLTIRAVGPTGRTLPVVSCEARIWGPDEVPDDLESATAQGRMPAARSLYSSGSSRSGECTELVPPGAGVACIIGHDALGRVVRGIRVPMGTSRLLEVVEFAPVTEPARVLVEVVDDLGEACVNASVQVFTSTGFFPMRTVAGEEGRMELELAPGPYRLVITSGERTVLGQSNVPTQVHLQLAAGDSRTVRAVTPRGGFLRVRVGAELDGLDEQAKLYVVEPGGDVAKCFFYPDDDGFGFPAPVHRIEPGARLRANQVLPPGAYKVALARAGRAPLVRAVDIGPGAIAEVTLP